MRLGKNDGEKQCVAAAFYQHGDIFACFGNGGVEVVLAVHGAAANFQQDVAAPQACVVGDAFCPAHHDAVVALHRQR